MEVLRKCMACSELLLCQLWLVPVHLHHDLQRQGVAHHPYFVLKAQGAFRFVQESQGLDLNPSDDGIVNALVILEELALREKSVQLCFKVPVPSFPSLHFLGNATQLLYEGDNKPCPPGLASNLTKICLYIKCRIELHKDLEMVNTYVQVHLTVLYIKATIRYHITPRRMDNMERFDRLQCQEFEWKQLSCASGLEHGQEWSLWRNGAQNLLMMEMCVCSDR